MRMKFFEDIFDTWVTSTPDGKPFISPPWENPLRANARPFYFTPYEAPVTFVFSITLATTLISFIITAKIVFPVCTGVLALLYYALKESWYISSAFHVTSTSPTQQVCEKQPFQIHLKIQNKGSFGPLDAAIYFEFSASTKNRYFIGIPQIDAGESFDVKVDMIADAGMGTFELRDIYLLTIDRFGLFRRCIKHEIALKLEVCPDYTAMPPIKINVTGKAMHEGAIESKTSGESTSFIGLRDFRLGDSVRQIDWKRSAKYGALIVRDFEKTNSTDATLFVDNRLIGVFEFNGLNSFEHLKDSIIALCHRLIDQGLRIQILVQDGRILPFGSGSRHLKEIIDLVRDLRPDSPGSLCDFLQQNKEIAPADSLVIPVFNAVQIDSLMLREVFFAWNALRCEVIPIIIDTPRFERHVVHSMESLSLQKMDLAFFRELYMGTSDSKLYENISKKIYENAILVGPGERLGDIYARLHPWQV